MTVESGRRLEALFTVDRSPRPAAEGRAYALTLRSSGGSALEGYRTLTLTELAPDETPDESRPGDQSGQAWATFELVQLDATVAASPLSVDHLHFVFSDPPEGISAAEYDEFYHEHLRENLQMESFAEGWRWRCVPIRLEDGGRSPGPHLALYRMEKEWTEAEAEISRHSARLRESWPAWFSRIMFCVVEARAI